MELSGCRKICDHQSPLTYWLTDWVGARHFCCKNPYDKKAKTQKDKNATAKKGKKALACSTMNSATRDKAKGLYGKSKTHRPKRPKLKKLRIGALDMSVDLGGSGYEQPWIWAAVDIFFEHHELEQDWIFLAMDIFFEHAWVRARLDRFGRYIVSFKRDLKSGTQGIGVPTTLTLVVGQCCRNNFQNLLNGVK